ncbi:MAG: HAD hydrolase-like protein [Alphaproteobacteria bacterium]|nr:HAD hydrolase-like protein [Alphaproteobacteria bacterium]
MPIRKPTIVIFDMDGTAVRHVNPRLLHILEFLDNLSYKTGKVFAWIFKRKGKGPIVPPHHKPRKQPRLLVHRAIHKFRRKPVEQIVEPCPGLYDVLEFFERNTIPLSLVSNGLGKGYGHDILKKFNLGKYFKATVFREDIVNSKPHPEPLLTALRRMDIDPDENDVIWYIGDRRKDVTAALAASEYCKGTFIPVAFGLNAATAILEKNIGPQHIVMSFHDMYDHLQEIFDQDPEGNGSSRKPATI